MFAYIHGKQNQEWKRGWNQLFVARNHSDENNLFLKSTIQSLYLIEIKQNKFLVRI